MKTPWKPLFCALIAAVALASMPGSAPAAQDEDIQQKSLVDHQAGIFNLGGKVSILKAGSELWEPLTRETVLEPGDEIRTGKDAFVEIYYDAFFLNIARIGEETLAEFRAIEPTDVFLSDGRVFSALDGLPRGSTYEVATPTSVAGVRGTSFLREFDVDTFLDTTLVIDGLVQVLPLLDEGGAIDRERLVNVRANHSLVFSGKEVLEKEVRDIEPREMTPDEKQMVEGMDHAAEENIESFAGGEDALEEAREDFHGMSREEVFQVFKQMRVEDYERQMQDQSGITNTAMPGLTPGPAPVLGQPGPVMGSGMYPGDTQEPDDQGTSQDMPDMNMPEFEQEMDTGMEMDTDYGQEFDQEFDTGMEMEMDTGFEQEFNQEFDTGMDVEFDSGFEQELEMEFENSFEDTFTETYEPEFQEPEFEEPEFEDTGYEPPETEDIEPPDDIDPCQYNPEVCEGEDTDFCTTNPNAPECI